MKITAILENTAENKELEARHGLSLYIESQKHKLLVDTGGSGAFIRNASRLGIDLGAVDTLIITHGHADHGGGLQAFLDVNTSARVYVQSSAFDKHYAKAARFFKIGVGLDVKLKTHPQVVLIQGDCVIDDTLRLIANPAGRSLMPRFNKRLYAKRGRRTVQDDFSHEQSVIISGEKTVLIAGCAHRGIINILEDAKQKTGNAVDVCIGGFHLFDPFTNTGESAQIIEQTAQALKASGTYFYTCHCTGKKPYGMLKALIPEAIEYLAAGQSVTV